MTRKKPIRRDRVKKILGLFFAAGLVTNLAAANNQQRPNVLFIAIDDLRPELGCYGDTVVKSPNIDKLASEGMVFNRAYCQVAVCGASRASLMTGILPTKNRYVTYLAEIDTDTPNAITMAQVFKDAGYTTAAHGKVLHTSTDAQGRSWSSGEVKSSGLSHQANLDPETMKYRSKKRKDSGRFFECVDVPDDAYGDGIVAKHTIEDLRKFKESGESFFLACGFIRPHLPFYAPKKYWDLYDEAMIPLADNRYRPKNAPKALGNGSGEYNAYGLGEFQKDQDAFHRKMRHGYYASTSYADKLTGDVLNELEKLGLAENTIVIVWGDHGWHLGEHNFWGKHNTLHNAIRIPLIVKVPGKKAGVKSDSIVQSVDIFPTLCSLAGLDVPDSVQGQSFEAVLDHPEQKINEVAYTRFKAGDAVVSHRYTYTRYENGDEMMYDLKKDPQENQNIAGNPEYRKALEHMRKELERQIVRAESATY